MADKVVYKTPYLVDMMIGRTKGEVEEIAQAVADHSPLVNKEGHFLAFHYQKYRRKIKVYKDNSREPIRQQFWVCKIFSFPVEKFNLVGQYDRHFVVTKK